MNAAPRRAVGPRPGAAGLLAAAAWAAVLTASAPAVHAAPVTIAFTGAVTSDPFGLSSFGAAISGAYTFNTAAVDLVPGTGIGVYASSGAAYGFFATVDGTAYGAPGNATVNIANNIGSDQYGVIATLGALTLELFLEDFTQTALASDALPAGAPVLAAFGVRSFRLFGDDVEFLGSVDTLVCAAGCAAATTVPEPGTLLLAAAAGLVLLRSGAGRRAARR